MAASMKEASVWEFFRGQGNFLMPRKIPIIKGLLLMDFEMAQGKRPTLTALIMKAILKITLKMVWECIRTLD